MKTIFTYLALLLICCSCNKEKFLEIKPDDSLVIPTTLTDFQALLDHADYMDGDRTTGGPNPGLLAVGSDEYYTTQVRYDAFFQQYTKNAYAWDNQNLYAGVEVVSDWATPYRTVYYANVVLSGLTKVLQTPANTAEYNNVKGSAHFYRALAYYQLAQVYAQPYNAATAATDLGLPIRLTPDVSEKTTRSSVQQTYDQITSDLEAALPLLPVKPLYNTRPSKPAAYALLARMYQAIEKYEPALQNAEKCLQLKNDLLDYNTLVASATLPMPLPIENKEVILIGAFESNVNGSTFLINLNVCGIDSTLYPLYQDGDLRKTVCYKNGPNPGMKQYKGSYNQRSTCFAGIATDEVFLVKAECQARNGDASGAMETLNILLKARWQTNKFIPLTASSAEDALNIVLSERRKELVMRGTRWADLRRLNKDPRFAKTIYHKVGNLEFSLPPGDPRYTWQIPDDVINLTGIQQNPR